MIFAPKISPENIKMIENIVQRLAIGKIYYLFHEKNSEIDSIDIVNQSGAIIFLRVHDMMKFDSVFYRILQKLSFPLYTTLIATIDEFDENSELAKKIRMYYSH